MSDTSNKQPCVAQRDIWAGGLPHAYAYAALQLPLGLQKNMGHAADGFSREFGWLTAKQHMQYRCESTSVLQW